MKHSLLWTSLVSFVCYAAAAGMLLGSVFHAPVLGTVLAAVVGMTFGLFCSRKVKL